MLKGEWHERFFLGKSTLRASSREFFRDIVGEGVRVSDV